MSLELPGWAASLLEELGFWWTQADEGKLGQAGTLVVDIEPLLDAVRHMAQGSASEVWKNSTGQGVDAFRSAWEHDDAPSKVLSEATSGMLAVGAGLFICAALVVALKAHIILQLAALATAIVQAAATAGVTLGASLLEIPVFKEVTGMLINALINLAVEPLLG